jgi:hypothetical protein
VLPGGQIYVDGRLMGRDGTGVLTLKAGSHDVKVVNRFLGEHTTSVDLDDGETGIKKIVW